MTFTVVAYRTNGQVEVDLWGCVGIYHDVLGLGLSETGCLGRNGIGVRDQVLNPVVAVCVALDAD